MSCPKRTVSLKCFHPTAGFKIAKECLSDLHVSQFPTHVIPTFDFAPDDEHLFSALQVSPPKTYHLASTHPRREKKEQDRQVTLCSKITICGPFPDHSDQRTQLLIIQSL